MMMVVVVTNGGKHRHALVRYWALDKQKDPIGTDDG